MYFPHKTFIYSNDLSRRSPRVPGRRRRRLALETGRGTGDRLSFLPDLLSVAGVYLAPGSHGGGFRPLTLFTVHRERAASHDQTWATRSILPRIYRVSIIAVSLIYRSWMLLFFLFRWMISLSLSLSLFASGDETVKPRASQRKSKARTWLTAGTWARRIPCAPLPATRASLLCARNQLLAQGYSPHRRPSDTQHGFPWNFDS